MIYPAIRTAMVFGLVLGFCLGFVTSEAVGSDRLTQHEIVAAVRDYDSYSELAAEAPTRIRGIERFSARGAHVHVRVLDAIVEFEDDATGEHWIDHYWQPETLTVKQRPGGVDLWSPWDLCWYRS